MKKESTLCINERKENIFSNPIFDFGESSTCTAITDYAKLKFIAPIEEVGTSELIDKLDSLQNEPAIECSNASEARLHIKKLMQK